jgi:hypothetical protein
MYLLPEDGQCSRYRLTAVLAGAVRVSVFSLRYFGWIPDDGSLRTETCRDSECDIVRDKYIRNKFLCFVG